MKILFIILASTILCLADDPKYCVAWHFNKQGVLFKTDTLYPKYNKRAVYRAESEDGEWYYSFARKCSLKKVDWERMELVWYN